MRLRLILPAAVLLALLPALPAVAAQSRLLFASGSWAAVDRGKQCEAASRSLRLARVGRAQAVAGFAFDAAGGRNGQFFARLSRTPRSGSSVMLRIGRQPFALVQRGDWAWSKGPAQERAMIAAARLAGGMLIESRDASGSRFVDRYALDGAATAIDAAAAACAAKLVNAGQNP